MKKWRRFLWVFFRTIVLIGLSIPFAYGVVVIGAHLAYSGGCIPWEGPRYLCSEAEYRQTIPFNFMFIIFMISWVIFVTPFSFMLAPIINGYKNKKLFKAIGLTLVSLILLAPTGFSTYYGIYFITGEINQYKKIGLKTETPVSGVTSVPSNQEAWPGVTGEWWDPQTSSASPGFVSLPTYVIVWQNGKYMVVSCSDPEAGEIFPITSQTWTGSTLTWSYIELNTTWTITVTATSFGTDSRYGGDGLSVLWSTSTGASGTKALIRAKCEYSTTTSLTPQATDQGPNPSLVGKWQDPETNDTFVIAWENGQYVVTSITREGTSYHITAQYWSSCHLTWSFYNSDFKKTVILMNRDYAADNSDILNVLSYFSDETLGTDTLNRVH